MMGFASDRLDGRSREERSRYILKWLTGGMDEGVAHAWLSGEKRFEILMDELNAARSKKAVVLKYPAGKS